MFGILNIQQNEENDEEIPDERTEALRHVLDPTILTLSGSFLLSFTKGLVPTETDGIIQKILSSLPPPSQARHMVDMYFKYGSWQ
jgi:hypothetical protein